MDNEGAKRLIAAVLKKAIEDYSENSECVRSCVFYETCGRKQTDRTACEAKTFLHSAWAATLCEGIDIDYSVYVLTAVNKYKPSKNITRYIEGELRNYQHTKQIIEKMDSDIIKSTPPPQEGHSSSPGDPTGEKVVKLLKATELERLKRTIAAIEKIYNACNGEMRKLIEEKYWKRRYTDEGIADLLGVSTRTIYTYKDKVVLAIAIELKYL